MRYIELAAETAAAGTDGRSYFIGAVAQRRDGAIVRSRNLLTRVPVHSAHAEARLCKKIDLGSTVYIARVLRTGATALAKPCPKCHALLRSKGVKKVFFTTETGEIASIEP